MRNVLSRKTGRGTLFGCRGIIFAELQEEIKLKNNKLLLAVIAFVAVIALFLTVYFVTRPTGTQGTKTFTLTIVHGDGSTKTESITTSQEFLAPALREEGFIGDEGIETGMYLTVDGETANWDPDQAYWSIYIGTEYATAGLNDIAIEDGASYKLEYTVSDYAG